MRKARRPQGGNILFLILLAVVLFAALSYAVTSGMRGGGNSASKESLQSQVAALQNTVMGVRSSLLRMTTTGGYQPWQIDYSKTNNSQSTANATCTTTACQLFDPAGGAVSALLPSTAWNDVSVCSDTTYGRPTFSNISVKGIGTDSQRDLMLVYLGVKRDLCMAINDVNGVANPGGEPPGDQTSGSQAYTGTLTQEVPLSASPQLGDEEPSLAGKQMFCAAFTNPSPCYRLYAVLIER